MKDHPSQWIYTGLTCCNVTRLATDYLEDRLPVFTKIRIGLHMASCVGCRSYVMQISLVSSVVSSLLKLYPPSINRLRLRQQFAAHHGQSVSGI